MSRRDSDSGEHKAKWKIIISNDVPNIDSIGIAWEKIIRARCAGSKHHNNIISIIYWICRTGKDISPSLFVFIKLREFHPTGFNTTRHFQLRWGRYRNSIENSFAATFQWSEKANSTSRKWIISRLFIMPIAVSVHWFHNEQDIWINKLISGTLKNFRSSAGNPIRTQISPTSIPAVKASP